MSLIYFVFMSKIAELTQHFDKTAQFLIRIEMDINSPHLPASFYLDLRTQEAFHIIHHRIKVTLGLIILPFSLGGAWFLC